MLRDYRPKKKHTLTEYYLRTYDHLVPSGVEFWEYDEATGKAAIWKIPDSLPEV